MPRYAELVYNGFWFSPERRALQAAIDETQKFCTGTVRVKLYKVCSSSYPSDAWCMARPLDGPAARPVLVIIQPLQTQHT